MNTQRHHPGTHPLTAARKAGGRLGRLTTVLAAITGSLLVTGAGVPAAFASMIPVPGPGGAYGGDPAAPTVRVVTAGGMAGWQITLIALAAALVAATTTVFVDRARTARRGATA
jgi:hypothetical protein